MKKTLWSFFEVFKTVIVAVTAVVLIRTFITQPFLVSGSSMEPSFKNGNYLLVDELTYRFREPERGEVIVFKSPTDSRSYYIKRIIGLPGEKLVIEENRVKIIKEGKVKVLEENYILDKDGSGRYEINLNEGEYFVMGDNRDFSFDSRSWGSLKESDIIGLVRFRLWPINEAVAITPPDY